MKNNKIYQLLALLIFLAVGLISCEETVWPEVNKLSNSDYLGTWSSQNGRSKITYIRTQDPKTNDYSARDTSVIETVNMQFQLGIARASGKMQEDSIKITTTTYVAGVAATPVVKTGYYSIGETAGSDFTNKAAYINVWEKATTINSGFANPVAEPYTTYTIVSKSATDLQLTWVLYNNTAQSSAKYIVDLKK